MSTEIPALPKVANVDQLVTHLNDRLRRISLGLGPGAQGPPGKPGPPGSSGSGGGTVVASAYPVPVTSHIALPDASQPVNLLTEFSDTFVSTPAGVPPSGQNVEWNLRIVLGAGGCSTSFAASYLFSITVTDASSPIGGTASLSLSTDSSGNTTLISASWDF